MTEQFQMEPAPAALRKTAAMLRKLSWANIWIQGILAVVAGMMILFTIGRNLLSQTPTGGSRAAGLTGAGIILLLSLVVQLYTIVRSFQCIQTGRRLKSDDPALRPSKGNTIDFLWRSVLISIAGLGLALLASQAIGGILLGRSAASIGAPYNPVLAMQVIEPLDIFLVLANTHILSAHGLGLAITLWLLNRIDR
jgi:uncharacterized protein YjeT (DUF2065 family)